MITKFAVTNYRGFSKRLEWDLSQPNNYSFNQFAVKDGIIKNGIIYGKNGKGKTNFSLSIFDIVNHLTQKYKKADYYRNFIYAGCPDGLVEFEYEFMLDRQHLLYTYGKNRDGYLIEERLETDGKQVFLRKGQLLEISQEFPMEAGFKENLERNANNVSIINVLLTSFPLNKDHYLLKMRNFVEGMLWFRNLDVREFLGLESNVYLLDEFIIENNLLDDFRSFLRDVSGQEFAFADVNIGDKLLFCLFEDRKVAFNVIASTGTQALMLLYFWLQKIAKATFVFIDEFDAFYHYELSFEVCKRLFRKKCQAFVSSHNTFLMGNDLLRPDCNFILEDNVIKPLCELTDKELRLGHNIEKLYRGKTFKS